MKKYVNGLIMLLRKEKVFSIAAFLAVISSIVVRPGLNVTSGIDCRTLALLFGLMTVVAGLQGQLVFTKIGNVIISKVSNTVTLYLMLVLICFVSAMLLTNDVALITFVPFTIMLLPMAGKKDKLPVVIILQTIAANLGSVLTPLGNPQNLYLYNISGMSLGEFVSWMLPLWIVSLLLVVIPIFFLGKGRIEKPNVHAAPKGNVGKQAMYIALFICCLLSVFKVLDYRILLVVVLVCALVFDRYTLLRVDYILLLTFIGFFVFIYNMKQLPIFVDWISSVVNGREFMVGVLASQVISNVPAAILLSGFTTNLKELLLAVDVGGLGTIIASMASLISYKLYCASEGSKPAKYMGKFTLFNIVYLVIAYVFCMFWY